MILGLCLEAVLGKYPVQAVQVTSPAKAANIQNHPIVAVESLKELFAYNLDEETGTANRCIATDIAIMRKNNAKQQLLSLITNYEYRGAMAVMDQYGSLFPTEVNVLLNHAAKRANLDVKAAKQWADKYGGPVKLYPVQDPRAAKLTEFFMVMSIRQQQGEIADFMLKITPFLYELTYTWLQDGLNFPIFQVIRIQDDHWILDEEKVKRYDFRLWEQLNTYYSGKFRSGSLSFANMLAILSCLASRQQRAGSATIVDNLPALLELREYEERVRNKTAHEITMVSEDMIHAAGVAIAKKTGRNRRHMSSSQLLKDLETVMRKLLGSRCAAYSFVYQDINRRIEELII